MREYYMLSSFHFELLFLFLMLELSNANKRSLFLSMLFFSFHLFHLWWFQFSPFCFLSHVCTFAQVNSIIKNVSNVECQTFCSLQNIFAKRIPIRSHHFIFSCLSLSIFPCTFVQFDWQMRPRLANLQKSTSWMWYMIKWDL